MSTEPLDTCGCCEGVTALTPAPLDNLPGLSALIYRAGTHASFKRTMQAALADQPALGALTTRDDSDPAIAMLDAWATLLDVLTFYQERIANEGYLRTATERRSVLELARAIGYELNPGVAASTYLAFTLEDAPGAPGVATIDIGTKVQSLPGPGEQPQTFETTEKIVARAGWNAMRPRLTQPQTLAIEGTALKLIGGGGAKTDATRLYLAGIQTNIKAGDLLLIALRSGVGGTLATLPKQIRRVAVENELNRTRVDFDLVDTPAPLPFVAPPYPPGVVDPPLVPQPIPFGKAAIDTYILGRSWNDSDLNAFIAKNGWNAEDLLDAVAKRAAPSPPPVDEGVFAFRARLAFFGHNAPRYDSLPKPAAAQAGASGMLMAEMAVSKAIAATPSGAGTTVVATGAVTVIDPDWDHGRTIWTDSRERNYSSIDGYDVYLERSLPELLDSSWAIFDSPRTSAARTPYWINAVTESSLADYAMSARASGLKLQNAARTGPPNEKPFDVRKSTAYVQSERMGLAALPIDDPIASGASDLMLDTMVLGLQVGQSLILSGEQAGTPGVQRNERVVLKEIVHTGGYTTLAFTRGLQYSYIRKTVTINANVAPATHGETRREVLGSGDASRPLQQFALKQAPLTYTAATTPSGAASTLQVRVNGVLWREAATLYGLAPRDRAYAIQIDDGGKATVQFGDGVSGARLPTGSENVTATYRVGTGLAGMVKAGQLSLLMTRPLGVKGVTNPLAAAGAEDPEARDRARQNAPFTVLTLGRIVSLQDFEDFARAFAGIGKAQATWLWAGESRLVHITVAAANGDAVDLTSPLGENLKLAIDAARDPVQHVLIGSFTPRSFSVAAKVLVDRDYLAAKVLPAVAAALQDAFSFARRSFGQAVKKSEVLAVIQAVAGAEAVDLDALYMTGASVTPSERLPAHIAQWDASAPRPTVAPAELLTLDQNGITLTEMQR